MWSRAELARGFGSLGVEAGDSVMLHASVRSVGEVAGGPDPLTTRSARSHGILVEFFGTYPGTLVNDHIARFAAAGANAAHLLAEQPPDFPFGIGSPLDRFLHLHGKILLLGSDHDEVTFLHYVEHVVDFPDKKIARYRVPCATETGVVWREVQEVNTAGDGAHASWPERFFAQLVDGYLDASANHGGAVGSSQAYLIPARELFDFAAPVMQRVAAEPTF